MKYKKKMKRIYKVRGASAYQVIAIAHSPTQAKEMAKAFKQMDGYLVHELLGLAQKEKGIGIIMKTF